ncbi:hypothetical protein A3Q56_03782 [Intoshia linei]|uniref:Retropepsins domain-containing protein n=1 Tax=Intoshia linei TaxID=1819745 RepID=A0A177B2I7_9BILA|nr:hypothetical protein A3Q56_03782 [Intoshia linei]
MSMVMDKTNWTGNQLDKRFEMRFNKAYKQFENKNNHDRKLNNVNKFDALKKYVNDKQDDESNDKVCYNCGTELKFNNYFLFHVDAKISNKMYSCLIDTGSIASFLPNSFKPHQKVKFQYTSVTNSKLNTSGVCNVQVKINSLKKSFRHQFVIS